MPLTKSSQEDQIFNSLQLADNTSCVVLGGNSIATLSGDGKVQI